MEDNCSTNDNSGFSGSGGNGGFFSKIKSGIGNFFSGIKNVISNGWNKIKSVGGQIGNKSKSGMFWIGGIVALGFNKMVNGIGRLTEMIITRKQTNISSNKKKYPVANSINSGINTKNYIDDEDNTVEAKKIKIDDGGSYTNMEINKFMEKDMETDIEKDIEKNKELENNINNELYDFDDEEKDIENKELEEDTENQKNKNINKENNDSIFPNLKKEVLNEEIKMEEIEIEENKMEEEREEKQETKNWVDNGGIKMEVEFHSKEILIRKNGKNIVTKKGNFLVSNKNKKFISDLIISFSKQNISLEDEKNRKLFLDKVLDKVTIK